MESTCTLHIFTPFRNRESKFDISKGYCSYIKCIVFYRPLPLFIQIIDCLECVQTAGVFLQLQCAVCFGRKTDAHSDTGAVEGRMGGGIGLLSGWGGPAQRCLAVPV